MIRSYKPFLPLSDYDIRRFWEKVDKSPGHGPNGDCWIWVAGKNRNGYGVIGVNGRSILAHRIACYFAHGELALDLDGLHKCDFPPCVRPDHLSPGTHEENMRERTGKKRHAFGDRHYLIKNPKLKLIGEKHPMVRLTEALVMDIRRRHSNGETINSIAESLGLGRPTVYYAATGKSWSHLPGACPKGIRKQILTEDIVRLIRNMRKYGYISRQISDQLVLPQSAVDSAYYYEKWRWVV